MRAPAPAPDPAPVVLIHGFGFHASVWEPLVARLGGDYTARAVDLPGYGAAPEPAPDAPPDWPEDAHWVGWSLGGVLALDAVRRGRRPRSLALLGAAPRMVRSGDWPHAIEPAAFAAFADAVARDPAAALTRFAVLVARGDRRERQVREQLRAHAAAPAAGTLRRGLAALRQADLRDAWAAHPVAQLSLWGEHDALLPAAGAAAARALRPADPAAVVPGAGHAPLLSDPAFCAERLRRFWAAA